MTVPSWLGSDWPLVGLSVIILLALVFGISALYGGLTTVVVTSGFDALVDGVTAGAYLAFSTFGIETSAFTSNGNVAIGSQFLPLPALALPVGATAFALRFAWSRLGSDRVAVLAFCAKLAVTAGIVMAILASVLSVGGDTGGSGLRAEVSGGEAWLYVTAIVAITALAYAHLRGLSVFRKSPKPQLRQLASVALDGARAYALVVGGMAAVALVAAIVVVDDGSERLGVILSVPFVGITTGVLGAAFAMGAAIGLGSGHVSLLHFGFPPTFDAGAAPIPFFVLLVLAPAAIAWITLRRLEAERPASEQEVLRVAFVIGIAFAVTAWFTTLVSQVALGAYAAGDDGDGTGVSLLARPSVAGVLGLGLLWGLAGALGSSFLWARQQGVGWTAAPGDAGPTTPSPEGQYPPPPPRGRPSGSEPMAADPCGECGFPLTEADAFCPGCGRRTR